MSETRPREATQPADAKNIPLPKLQNGLNGTDSRLAKQFRTSTCGSLSSGTYTSSSLKRTGSACSSDRESICYTSNDNLDSGSDRSSSSSSSVRSQFANATKHVFPGFQFHLSVKSKSGVSNTHEGGNSESSTVVETDTRNYSANIFTASECKLPLDSGCDLSLDNQQHDKEITKTHEQVMKSPFDDRLKSGLESILSENCATSEKSCDMGHPVSKTMLNCAGNSADTSEGVSNTLSVEHEISYPDTFLQWRNKDALCWLDVILCLSVHNETLRRVVKSEKFDTKNLIYKLVLAHCQAQQILKKVSVNISESRNSSLLSSESRCMQQQDESSTEVGSKSCENKTKSQCHVPCNMEENEKICSKVATTLLNKVRERIWKNLKTKLRCKKGQHESPVFAFPLFLRHSQPVTELFKLKYR